ncbi:MAG: hemolysin family protein [Saprospiraceae bacterium]|nr:hemolysin family protein [Saprospiraceae bacterium]MDW8483568.1 hemolysin family protein [Saprospiraceae bacterium]
MDIAILLLLVGLHSFLVLGKTALGTGSRLLTHRIGTGGGKIPASTPSNPEVVEDTLHAAIVTTILLEGAYAGIKLGGMLVSWLSSFLWLSPYAHLVSIVSVLVMVGVLALVVGEWIPRYVAAQFPEGAATLARPVVFLTLRLLQPVYTSLQRVTKWVLGLFILKPVIEPHVSEEEIKNLVLKANRQGVLEEKESEFIQNILRFADRDAYAIMTHRNELKWLDVQAPLEENDRIIRESGYTKFLLCDGAIENVIGVVKLRDYIDHAHKPGFDLRQIATPPLYIPETMNALKILERFRNERNYFAVVVDEYGSIQGIITLHDLTESILGNLPDVDDAEEPAIITREDGSWLVEGSILVDELREIVPIAEFENPDTDYATLAGYILHKIGEIPRAGDYFTAEGFRFEVVDMDKSKIDKVLISRIEELPQERV